MWCRKKTQTRWGGGGRWRGRELVGTTAAVAAALQKRAGDCRMKIAFRRYTRSRPVRSLVDLISYAELSSRSMQVALLFCLSLSLSFYTLAPLFHHFPRYHLYIASCGSTIIGSEKSNLQLTGNFLRLFCAPNHRIVRCFSWRITRRGVRYRLKKDCLSSRSSLKQHFTAASSNVRFHKTPLENNGSILLVHLAFLPSRCVSFIASNIPL